MLNIFYSCRKGNFQIKVFFIKQTDFNTVIHELGNWVLIFTNILFQYLFAFIVCT